mgnify:FL=1
MKLIVGLGNPGPSYANARHSAGFLVIDALAQHHQIAVNKIKHKGLEGNGHIGEEKVVLLKPQTYMNLSGGSVREAMDFYKLTPADLMVIYDDISLPVGAVRIREKGSDGGHNGMKDIIRHLGTEDFVRIRMGVGAKPAGWNLADYVLSAFPSQEREEVSHGIMVAGQAVEDILTIGLQKAMNRANLSVKAAREKTSQMDEKGK